MTDITGRIFRTLYNVSSNIAENVAINPLIYENNLHSGHVMLYQKHHGSEFSDHYFQYVKPPRESTSRIPREIRTYVRVVRDMYENEFSWSMNHSDERVNRIFDSIHVNFDRNHSQHFFAFTKVFMKSPSFTSYLRLDPLILGPQIEKLKELVERRIPAGWSSRIAEWETALYSPNEEGATHGNP